MKRAPVLLQLSPLPLLLVLAGCSTIATDSSLGVDASGHAIKSVIPNKSLVLSKSVSIPIETLALAAAVYLVVDPLSPNWQIEQTAIGGNRFRIALRKKRFAGDGDGEAPQVFYRRAEQIVQENGSAGYTVLEFGEGIDSTVPVAQRVAQGVIQLR